MTNNFKRLSHPRHRTTQLFLFGFMLLALSTGKLLAQPGEGKPGAPETKAAEPAEQSTSIGGYGEAVYVEPEGPTKGSIDIPRFVLFVEHTFSDDITFFSEVEVEHVRVEGALEGGELEIEQAYLQYHLSDRLNVRAGLLVLPIGIINEYHEPPSFNGARRPMFDQVVIPTTWRELGVGIAGRIPEVEGLQYRACLTSGLNASGFSGAIGISEGRLEGANPAMQSLAFSGRLEYVTGGLRAGGWLYYGGSSYGDERIADGLFGAPVTMYGLDAQYSIGDLNLRGIIGQTSIAEAGKINDTYHSTLDSLGHRIYSDPIGSAVGGGYIEAAYNIAQLLSHGTTQQLLPFVRYERFNTNQSMPNGIEADKANDRTYVVAGLTYKPTYNTVVKVDWTMIQNATDEKVPGEFAVGVGYNF
ncbi:MAG TPA: hypothetical protein VHI13_19310 [Candidatus Kapabacteria bacterium]|nr:hypothetical protein [Candidatus Kapabacteria bacterium]